MSGNKNRILLTIPVFFLVAFLLLIPANSLLVYAEQQENRYDNNYDEYGYESNRYYKDMIQYKDQERGEYEKKLYHDSQYKKIDKKFNDYDEPTIIIKNEPIPAYKDNKKKEDKKEPAMLLVEKEVLFCDTIASDENSFCENELSNMEFPGPDSGRYIECTDGGFADVCEKINTESFNIVVTDDIEFPGQEEGTKFNIGKDTERYTVLEEGDSIDESFVSMCLASGFDDGIIVDVSNNNGQDNESPISSVQSCVLFEGECSGIVQNNELIECTVQNYIVGVEQEQDIELQDLAVANFDSEDVTILLGDGDGTFTEANESPITVGTGPLPVTTGLFDNDSVLDLAVANFDSDDVTILLGDGDGTFTEANESPITVEDGPSSVTTGLFDNDSVLDLAVANFDSDDVTILLGDGDGTFTEANESPITVGTGAFSVTTGLFDNDSVLDLAVANFDSDDVTILLGDGDGTFTEANESPITVGTGPSSVTTGLFDNDSVLDLAVANSLSGDVTILLGDGDGTFTEANESPITVEDGPNSVTTGLFDNDSVLDLAVANSLSGDVTILLGDGDGTFTEANESPITVEDGPNSVTTGLFDNDSVLDLAVVNSLSDNVTILLGDGDGTFTEANESPITVGTGAFSVTTGNFN